MEVRNIFNKTSEFLEEEFFETILETNNIKLERIFSQTHSSPPGFWFDQEKNEFVLLLQGSAQLSFDDGAKVILHPGDYIVIPSHKKHRIDWTNKKMKTIWLTVYY